MSLFAWPEKNDIDEFSTNSCIVAVINLTTEAMTENEDRDTIETIINGETKKVLVTWVMFDFDQIHDDTLSKDEISFEYLNNVTFQLHKKN